MAIYPGGKSTRIDSPRHLTIRHSRRVVAASRFKTSSSLVPPVTVLADGKQVDDEIDPLPPGQQKLNSFWAPGLEAGPMHVISLKQTVKADNSNDTLVLEAEQGFYVDAPQFSLPDGSVHSTYPPAGYSDDHRILPHVVLTDPHLPWERLGSPKSGTNKQLKMQMKRFALGAKDASVPRNRVPWLVMFAFAQDELRLPPEDLDGIFRTTSQGVIKPVKQSSTMTVNMGIEDLWKLSSDVTTPVTTKLGPESMKDSRGDFIFVQPELFTSLFSKFDDKGNREKGSKPDTSQYQYLSHVRKINGSGMALAGVEDTAVFSIVVGNRSGPLDNVLPTTMCAHLVSIEGVEAMDYPSTSHRYVALCSLYSWNYTVLPPNTLNVPDAFEKLGRTLNVLRAPEEILAPLQTSEDKIKQLVGRRLNDGYTLVKYRTQTGEATVALYRGPFTPTYVPNLEHLTSCSTSGVDLQVLDKQLGIMDVTYSVAWQVGRTLALGDQAFTAALGRVRTAVHAAAAKQVKISALKAVKDTAFRTRDDLLGDLPLMIKGLAAIHLQKRDSDLSDPKEPQGQPRRPGFRQGGARKRWSRRRLQRDEMPRLSFSSPTFEKKYPAAALESVRQLAASRSGDPYDETNDPQSTDWMIVLSWLVDRMFLAGVPAHCLLPDPTYLQPESLRFFHIDKNWVDALIDGALSLGNHFGTDEDRVAIKKALNDYINRTPEGQDHRVQIPAYGFYLRSDLVTMFPDLRVEVKDDPKALKSSGQDAPTGAPLLRHEIVADGVMMAFMDRVPGSAQFSSLVLTQPSHQQRFAVGRDLDTANVVVDIRRQYTVDQTTRETDALRHKSLTQVIYNSTGEDSSDNIFIWGSEPGKNDLRILRLPSFADVQLKILQEQMGHYQEQPYFQEDASSSALFAMQLNDPIYNLTIKLDNSSKAKNAVAALAPPDVGKGSPELRTVRMLQAVRFKKLDVGGVPIPSSSTLSSGSSPEDDKDSGTLEEDTFKRPTDYMPSLDALSNYLAPNVRALPLHRGSQVDEPSSTDTTTLAQGRVQGRQYENQPPGSEPASAPRFLIRVSSNLVDNHNEIRLDRDNLPQDLIFSIALKQSEISQYLLMEVTIDVPIGTPEGSRYFLMQNYTGPGAHMLTNLRFNVVPTTYFDTNQNQYYLRIRLLPRAERGWVIAPAVPELSFLLGLARINAPSTGSSVRAMIQSRARYCRDPSQAMVEPNVIIVNNAEVSVDVVRS